VETQKQGRLPAYAPQHLESHRRPANDADAQAIPEIPAEFDALPRLLGRGTVTINTTRER
jgi:hypothetical protein